MKQPDANHRPIHGGYPEPEGSILRRAGRRALAAVTSIFDRESPATGPVIAVAHPFGLDHEVPADPDLTQRLIDLEASKRQRALGGWDAEGNPDAERLVDALGWAGAASALDPRRMITRDYGEPIGTIIAPADQHPAIAADALRRDREERDAAALGRRVQAEFAAGAESVRIDTVSAEDAAYVPHDMLVQVEHVPADLLDAADAELATHDRARRGTNTHPQRAPRGVDPGFAFEGAL